MRLKHTLILVFTLMVAVFSAGSKAWAASIAVNSTTDKIDGDTSSIADLTASPGSDGVISLHEAINLGEG